MTIFRYRSAHRGKSSDGLAGGSLAGRYNLYENISNVKYSTKIVVHLQSI